MVQAIRVLFAEVSVAVAVVAALVGLPRSGDGEDRSPQSKLEGKIVAPKEGEKVEKELEVKARVSGLPKGYTVVACVEQLTGGLCWPKSPFMEAFRPGEYSTRISEGGELGSGMRVSILAVPPKGLKELERWFEHGKKTGEFPGWKVADIKGAERLDSVKVKMK